MSLYKVYDMETITQDKLNELVLERNTLAEEVEKLKSIKKDIKKYVDSTDFIYDKQYIRQDKIKDILDKDN